MKTKLYRPIFLLLVTVLLLLVIQAPLAQAAPVEEADGCPNPALLFPQWGTAVEEWTEVGDCGWQYLGEEITITVPEEYVVDNFDIRYYPGAVITSHHFTLWKSDAPPILVFWQFLPIVQSNDLPAEGIRPTPTPKS